jgi:hypothetical protein
MTASDLFRKHLDECDRCVAHPSGPCAQGAWLRERTVSPRLLLINACAYCGKKSEGHASIERDGAFSGSPQVPLCDDCGTHPEPSTQEIWARISLADDDGTEWGPTIHRCDDARKETR